MSVKKKRRSRALTAKYFKFFYSLKLASKTKPRRKTDFIFPMEALKEMPLDLKVNNNFLTVECGDSCEFPIANLSTDWTVNVYHWRQHGGKDIIQFRGELCSKIDTTEFIRFFTNIKNCLFITLSFTRGNAIVQNQYPHEKTTTDNMLSTNPANLIKRT